MTEQEFTQLLEDIRNQIIKTEGLEILIRNSNGDLINEDTIIIDDERVLSLAEALQYNHHITHLNLNNNDIGDTGAIALSKVNTLKRLELYGNHIGLKGATALIKVNLESLVLAGNILHLDPNDAGAIELTEALIDNHTIKNLDFECCLFSDQLVNKLIKENNTITTLNLSYNHLTDASLQSLSLNNTLEVLYVSNNIITNAGIDYILGNTHLNYISLANTNITIEGAKKFIGSYFDQVKIFNNDISMHEINIFNQAFEEAKQLRNNDINFEDDIVSQNTNFTNLAGDIDHQYE